MVVTIFLFIGTIIVYKMWYMHFYNLAIGIFRLQTLLYDISLHSLMMCH